MPLHKNIELVQEPTEGKDNQFFQESVSFLI